MSRQTFPASRGEYFPALTGVRALAAYLVFLHHWFIPEELLGGLVYSLGREGHIGVTLFFVLSGFLISYRYAGLRDFSFRTYMVNRIARIYPMYFLLTSFTFAVFLLQETVSTNTNLGLYVLNISFLRGFFDRFKLSGIPQGWSLTVEESFYILAPLFFLMVRRSRTWLLTLPAIIVLCGVALVHFFSRFDLYGFFSSFEFMFNYTFFGRCTEFFTGMLLAGIYRVKGKRDSFRYFTWLGVAGITFCVFLLDGLRGSEAFGIRHPMGKLVNTLVLPLIGILPLYYGLLTEKTVFSRLLGSRLFVLLGKSSYIFYLIHLGVIASFLKQMGSGFLYNFVALNLVSVLLFRYLEDPLNKYIRRKAGRDKPAETVAAELATAGVIRAE